MSDAQRLRLFIASSREGLEVARALQLQLERDVDSLVWTDGVFAPTDYALESLASQLALSDCGIFVLTADDVLRTRGRQRSAPRDNVIFELGMFIGGLGRRRAIVVKPRNIDLQIPSDMWGVSSVEYEPPIDPSAIERTVGPACTRIRQHLSALTPRHTHMTWEELCDLVKELASSLRRSSASGGYTFDAIVGISRGGLTVADLLSRLYGGTVPVVGLWADRHASYPLTTFDDEGNWVNRGTLEGLRISRVRNLLVVDDITRRTQTITAATEFLRQALVSVRVKSAILLAPPSAVAKVDYIARVTDTAVLRTPFVRVEQ